MSFAASSIKRMTKHGKTFEKTVKQFMIREMFEKIIRK